MKKLFFTFGKPLMKVYEESESDWENFGEFINPLQHDTCQEVVKDPEKLYKQQMSLLFNQTCSNEGLLANYIYIYIYIYILMNYFCCNILLIFLYPWNLAKLYIQIISQNLFIYFFPAKSVGTVEYTNCTSAGVGGNECLGYDIKQSDGKAPVLVNVEYPFIAIVA